MILADKMTLAQANDYLAWSFYAGGWKSTWIVWPVAGVAYALVRCLCGLLIPRKE